MGRHRHGRRGVTAPAMVMSLHARGESTTETRTYPGRAPVLVVSVGGARLMVSTSDPQRVTAKDVEFAQVLADQASAFAHACERMYRGLGHDPA
ncbi:hypothetical protein [Nocardiopsis rhodophaea]|uniref:hypothetical protein n=1 Tax=Nocardiopsis rhodophaea TaxID=280238 RepID=UPI0031CF83D8